MAGVLGVLVAVRRIGLAHVAAPGFVALMALEQLWTMVPFTLKPASTVLRAPPSPAIQFLQHGVATGGGRMIGIPYLVGHPISPMLFGLPDLRNMSALTIRRYYDYLTAISPKNAEFVVQDIQVSRSPALDRAAVRYVVLPAQHAERRLDVGLEGPPPPDSETDLRLAYADARVHVYENRAALPRVRIVHDAVRLPNAAAARTWVQTLATRAADGRDQDDIVAIEPDDGGVEAPAASGRGSASETARLVDQEDPDHLVVEARLERPGFVVIADTYYPGWTASIDGAPTTIFPADLLFRAVYVPAGTHTVELRYQPASLFYGVLVSAGAVFVCGVLIIQRPRSMNRALP
jgi:hypothetical protein